VFFYFLLHSSDSFCFFFPFFFFLLLPLSKVLEFLRAFFLALFFFENAV